MLTNTRIAITYLFLVKVRDGRVRFFLHFVSSNVSEGTVLLVQNNSFFKIKKFLCLVKKEQKRFKIVRLCVFRSFLKTI